MDRITKLVMVFIVVAGFLFCIGHGSYCYSAEVIKIGVTPDLTGRTSEVGIPWADGIKDFFKYTNDQGGINGKKIELTITDCQKQIAQEVSAYKKYTKGGNTPLVFTYDTGACMTIAPMAAKDKVVQITASMIGQLGDAQKRPYSFLAATSYQRQTAALVNYALMEFKGKGRKPTFGITYPDTGFGRMVLGAYKQALESKGLQSVQEVIVPIRVLDAKVQMSKIKKTKPDFVLVLGVESTVAGVMKDAERVGISFEKTTFTTLTTAVQSKVIALGGEIVGTLVGARPFNGWNDTDVEGIKLIHQINKKYHQDISFRPLWYTYGFLSAMVGAEGLKRIPAGQEISGENLKKALETLKNFDCQGIVSPIAYTSADHSGPRAVKLVSPNVKNKRMETVSGWVYAD